MKTMPTFQRCQSDGTIRVAWSVRLDYWYNGQNEKSVQKVYVTEYGLKANDNPTRQTYSQNANEYPTKQTFTFTAVRCDRRKQEKPVPEITSGRVALYLEWLKTPWNKAFLHRKKVVDFLSKSTTLFGARGGTWTRTPEIEH